MNGLTVVPFDPFEYLLACQETDMGETIALNMFKLNWDIQTQWSR